MLKPQKGKPRFKKSEKGMALIESVPVLFMMVLIFNFSLGFFGAVHSGILNSIGSYNYAMETFRFKSNLMYFRPGSPSHYDLSKNRVHGTTEEGSEEKPDEKGKWPATKRSITFNFSAGDATKNLSAAISKVGPESARNYAGGTSAGNIWYAKSEYAPAEGEKTVQTPRIWIKTVYGICLSAECGDN